MSNKLIYGKCQIERIVSMEVNDSELEVFFENKNGKVSSKFYPIEHWFLSDRPINRINNRLRGNLHYKYINTFRCKKDMFIEQSKAKKRDWDIWRPGNLKECAMLRNGMTYFKGMKHDEISVLSFDIETTSLEHNDNAFIILISNTIRKAGKTERKLFSYDEYNSEREMLEDWCKWVRKVDPSVICGHNIFMYDLPYLQFIADRCGARLELGRNGSKLYFSQYERRFRRDSTMFFHYQPVSIYGREIVDTMFLSYKYDIGRKYDSYALKKIIAQEGLEVEGRQHYEAWKIRHNYKDPVEWSKIKKYSIHDADDSLSLLDLMCAPFFYLTQSVPKSFQEITCTASGSQINSVMIRAYLQDDHSIPTDSKKVEFEGAISIGNPGIYRNSFKVDVASLYPSIMIWGEVADFDKDPKGYFPLLIKEFTVKRLEHKKKAKEDPYYDGLQQAEKIFINSCYGFLGATGLHFNCPEGAEYVTRTGREILSKAIKWATGGDVVPIPDAKKGEPKWKIINTDPTKRMLVNCDTDSVTFSKPNFEEITEEERVELLKDLNSNYPDLIKWEDDGYYLTIIVIRAKNYILWDGKKIIYKGSAVKATTKESALQEFIKKIIDSMLEGHEDYAEIYTKYVKEVMNITDINRWVSKKTITDKVLNPKRLNEEKVLKAIQGKDYSEGDKAYFFFKSDESLSLVEDFDGDYNHTRLLKKLFNTGRMFETVLPIKEVFPNYSLKRNQEALMELLTIVEESGKIVENGG